MSDFPDVPEAVGDFEDWDQGRTNVKEGYQAFVDGKSRDDNPYFLGPGEKFSGYKRRRQKLWATGYALAAVAVGDCDDLSEAREEYNLRALAMVPSPRKHIYDEGYDTYTSDEKHEYMYRARSVGMFPTRHEAIGEAVKGKGGGRTRDVLNATRWVDTLEHVRDPQLPPTEENEDTDHGE